MSINNHATVIVETKENGEIVEKKVEVDVDDFLKVFDESLVQSFYDNRGIGVITPEYLEVRDDQDEDIEFVKIAKFLTEYMSHYAKNNNMSLGDLRIEFINYGRTELVFVLTDANGKDWTLLVKQPVVKMGDVHEEMQNLSALHQRDERVIGPVEYFMGNNQELYVTPYINQARCIVGRDTWGVFVPEPFYRFDEFTEEEADVINACMIAKLVSLFDLEKNEGISAARVGGGDFMLSKGYEDEAIILDNVYDKLYLIAARKKVQCSLDDYIEIIRNEFSRVTINEDASKLVINLRGRVAMTKKQIETGIEMGLKKLYGISEGVPNKMLQK